MSSRQSIKEVIGAVGAAGAAIKVTSSTVIRTTSGINKVAGGEKVEVVNIAYY